MKKVLILFGIILIIALAIRLMTTHKSASAGASSWRRGGNTNRIVTVTAAEVEYKNFRDMPVLLETLNLFTISAYLQELRLALKKSPKNRVNL